MTEITTGPVRVERDDTTTTISFAQPERSNAITVAAMRAFIAGLQSATDDGSLVLVIAGDGADFTLGRDQSERPADITRLQSLGLILQANQLLANFPGVSVCLVQGRALGFGSGLAVQSDITIAADDATFGFDEVNHGLAPLVVAEYLPRFVGPKIARDLIFTGRPVSAGEALALGMISRVAPAASLADAGADLIARLTSLQPGALRLMKRYSIDLAGQSLHDPQQQAIEWLDDWLTAGRPAHP